VSGGMILHASLAAAMSCRIMSADAVAVIPATQWDVAGAVGIAIATAVVV
jgi:hypothetical protein